VPLSRDVIAFEIGWGLTYRGARLGELRDLAREHGLLAYAIATAMVHGPSAGLELVATLDEDGRLAGHYRLDAVRAHLLEMAGDRRGAIEHYFAAASRTANMPERHYLTSQAARLAEERE